MTDEEASKILLVIAEADGGCTECVYNLMEDLMKSFPETPWLAIGSLSESHTIKTFSFRRLEREARTKKP